MFKQIQASPLGTIGEGLKKLDKITNGELLAKYPEIEWKKVKGLRAMSTK